MVSLYSAYGVSVIGVTSNVIQGNTVYTMTMERGADGKEAINMWNASKGAFALDQIASD